MTDTKNLKNKLIANNTSSNDLMSIRENKDQTYIPLVPLQTLSGKPESPQTHPSTLTHAEETKSNPKNPTTVMVNSHSASTTKETSIKDPDVKPIYK